MLSNIARPRFYDETGQRLGSKTIVMDHVEGTPLQLTLGPDADVGAARSIFLEHCRVAAAHPTRRAAAGHGQAARLGHVHRQRDRHLRPSRARVGGQQPGHPLCRRLVARQPATTCPARGRPRRFPTGEHPDQRRPSTRGHRLGIRSHRRPPRRHRLLQRQPAAEQLVHRRSGGVPRRVQGADRLHRRAGQPSRSWTTSSSSGWPSCSCRCCRAPTHSPAGTRGGIMAPFLVNSLCYFQERYFEICTR